MTITPDAILDALQELPTIGPIIQIGRAVVDYFGSPEKAQEHLAALRAGEIEHRKDVDRRLGG